MHSSSSDGFDAGSFFSKLAGRDRLGAPLMQLWFKQLCSLIGSEPQLSKIAISINEQLAGWPDTICRLSQRIQAWWLFFGCFDGLGSLDSSSSSSRLFVTVCTGFVIGVTPSWSFCRCRCLFNLGASFILCRSLEAFSRLRRCFCWHYARIWLDRWWMSGPRCVL